MMFLSQNLENEITMVTGQDTRVTGVITEFLIL